MGCSLHLHSVILKISPTQSVRQPIGEVLISYFYSILGGGL